MELPCGSLCKQQHHMQNFQRWEITLAGHSSTTPDGSECYMTLSLTSSTNATVTFQTATWDGFKTCSVVSACQRENSSWEKYPLEGTLSGDVSKYVPQAGTGQKEGLQVSRDIWDDGDGLECRETGGFEARRPPDISGRWCGTATTVCDFGSLGQQDRLLVVCTPLEMPWSVLDSRVGWMWPLPLHCAASPLGQDHRLKFPFCSSVLGNVAKSHGQGKGDVAETGDSNLQKKIFCVAVSSVSNTRGS